MEIHAAHLGAEEAYKLLIGAVVPRPIAWVTTISSTGCLNAAPFSAFTIVCNKPPMLCVSIARRHGELKDTARNILDRGEFVVNIAHEELVEPLHFSSAEFPEGVSEVEALSIPIAPSRLVAPPRIAAAPVNMECRLHQVLEFGDERHGLFIGEVLLFHVRDEASLNGRIDTERLRPLARLGGPKYARLGEIISMEPLVTE